MVAKQVFTTEAISCNYKVLYYIFLFLGLVWPYSIWMERKLNKYSLSITKLVTIWFSYHKIYIRILINKFKYQSNINDFSHFSNVLELKTAVITILSIQEPSVVLSNNYKINPSIFYLGALTNIIIHLILNYLDYIIRTILNFILKIIPYLQPSLN